MELSKDHFITRDGETFAGLHLIVDFWGASYLNNIRALRSAMIKATTAARATLLHIHLHRFGGGGGVSGVAVLVESHISVHTWPERGFAAFDIFMCGDADPYAAVDVLKESLTPGSFSITEQKRGVVQHAST